MGLRTPIIGVRRLTRARMGRMIATAFVTLISAALLVPSAALAQESPSSLAEIYAALRPENLRTTTGGTAFSQGDSVELLYDLVNTSEQPLVIPLTDFFGSSFHLVGTEQAWIERLGPDSTIPSIPPIVGRKGTWYATGGAIIALEGLTANTIPPGGRVTRQVTLIHPTGAFPSGRYRFHVEYKPLFGGLFDVIAEVSLDVTFGAVDDTPPVLDVSGDLTADATGPDGVALSFEASATDAIDGPVPVTCTPPSGTTFAIGTTTVVCSATDASGNEATASFTVHVKGAHEQLLDLLDFVDSGSLGLGTSLHDKLVRGLQLLAAGDVANACGTLNAFVNNVRAQTGKSLTPAQTAELTTDALRIENVIGC